MTTTRTDGTGLDRAEADRFREILAAHVPEDSEFYQNVSKGYDIFSAVLEKAVKAGGLPQHGMGIIFCKTGEMTSALEDAIEEAEPYNGRPHSLYDHDINQVVGDRCTLDGALLALSSGLIQYAGVELPLGTPGYKRKYGIPRDVKMKEFMEFDDTKEPVGFRTRAALNASDVFGEQMIILTLGEGGEINLYYCGDRIYNSAGREMHWELAERMPRTRNNVVPLSLTYALKPEPPQDRYAATQQITSLAS